MIMDTKSFLQSKTIWGALIALASAVAPIVLPMVGVQPGEMASVVGALGAILAIWGRVTAKKLIV